MRLVTISTAVGVLLAVTFVPAYARQGGNSQSHAPKTTTTHGASTSHVPSTAHGPSTARHAASSTASTKGAKAAATSAGTTTSTTGTSSSGLTSSTTGTTTAIDFTSTPVGQKLSSNSALRSKLQSRLTALGYGGTVYQAAYGFRNLGQFVAATNVSRNLGVSFTQLKTQMTGLSVKADGTVLKANLGADGKVTMVDPADVTNAAPTRSLGQSIQSVKSGVDATAAAQTATTQADAEIQSTSTTVNR